MASIDSAAPQFLVEKLEDSLDFYERRLGLFARPLERRPWGARDFSVEDPDGYILCFSEVG